jgi:hypothetical protein
MIVMLVVTAMSFIKNAEDPIDSDWFKEIETCSEINIRVPSTYESVTYTGLPEDENVRIYPESHIIADDEFRIVFENNRKKSLFWGSSWSAEKCVGGEWVEQEFDWAWTAELRGIGSFGRIVNTHKFPFDAGVYRISKKCMLSDVYLRDERRWRDEFTATFYLIKTP